MKKMRIFTAILIILMLFTAMNSLSYASALEPEQSSLLVSQNIGPVKEVTPVLVKAASYNYEKIKLTWEPVAGADGYSIYRATSKSGKYTLVSSKVAPEKTTYINGSRTTGRTYYYKIRAYTLSGSNKVYSKYSSIKSAYARPNKAVITSVGTSNDDVVHVFFNFELSWKKVSGASGYQIYMRKKGDDSFKFQGNFKGLSGSIEIPQTYYEYDLKVRAYRVVNGKKVYGLFSEVKNYEFTWDGEDLKKAAEDYVIKEYGTIIDEYGLEGKMTPYNSSWSACWPKHFVLYEPWDEVKERLERALRADMKFYGEPLSMVCFYLDPDISENIISIYMLN